MIYSNKILAYADLAQACYSDFKINSEERYSGSKLIAALQRKDGVDGINKEEWPDARAQAFVEQWEVVSFQPDTGSGFSATLFRAIKDDPVSGVKQGDLVYAPRGTQGLVDISEDANNLVADGLAFKQIVDMYNDWQQISTPKSQTVKQARLVEADKADAFQGIPPVLKSGLIQDITLGGFSALPKYYQIVIENTSNNGLGLVNTASIDVTGHSLGGHLSSAFSRLFPAQVNNVITFNGAGYSILGGGTSATDGNVSTVFSLLGGVSGFDASKILNIYGDRGIEFTTQNAWFGLKQPGGYEAAIIEDAIGSTLGHGMAQMAVSMAMYELFRRMEGVTGQTAAQMLAKYRPMIEAASSDQYLSFEKCLDAVRAIVMGDTKTSTTKNNSESFYNRLLELENSDAFKTLSGKVTIELSSTALASRAKDNFSALVSLFTLSPITLVGRDEASQGVLDALVKTAWQGSDLYAQWQVDQQLTPEQRAAGEANFSDAYLQDRAKMLGWVVKANQSDVTKLSSDSTMDTWCFKDETSGQNVTVAGKSDPYYSLVHDIYFGGAGNDTFTGGNLNDDLYGGAGNDTLSGGLSNDYLEGGTGNDELHGENGKDKLLGGLGADLLDGSDGDDTLMGGADDDVLTGGKNDDLLQGGSGFDLYSFNTGDGHDIIDESMLNGSERGSGTMKINTGITLAGTTAPDGLNVWQDKDHKIDYVWNPDVNGVGDLLIHYGDNDSITVKGFRSGDFGIALTHETLLAPFLAAGTDGNDSVEPGTTANIATYGGNDYVSTYYDWYDPNASLPTGDSWIDVGDGNDFVHVGIGREHVFGGAGNDIIQGEIEFDASSQEIENCPWSAYVVNNSTLITYQDPPLPGSLIPNIYPDMDNRHFRTASIRTYSGNMNHPVFPMKTSGSRVMSYPFELNGVIYNGSVFVGPSTGYYADGGSGDDFLGGGVGDDTLLGGTGADILLGMLGDDLIEAGDGNDQLVGGLGLDSLIGDAGDDTLYGGDAGDYLDGGDGDDQIFGGEDYVSGASRNGTYAAISDADQPWQWDGDDELHGGRGNDSLNGEAGSNRLFGDDGNDFIIGNNEYVAVGKHGNNYLDGGNGDDTLLGGVHDDTIYGGEDNDYLLGDIVLKGRATADIGGKDEMHGNGGNDTLIGGVDADWLYGDEDNDVLVGAADGVTSYAPDHLFGGDGNDMLYGAAGDDELHGDGGSDTLVGDTGNDWLYGDDGNDFIVSGYGDTTAILLGNDHVFGGEGNDSLAGSGSNDVLDGGNGDDLLWAKNGDDTLIGGAGSDSMSGGAGNDTYIIGAGDGTDLVVDESGDDVLVLTSVSSLSDVQLSMTVDQQQLVILAGGQATYIENGLSGAIEKIRLAGGDEYSISNLITNNSALLIFGSNDDDTIQAANNGNTLVGGAGNDTLLGGIGNDIYLFNQGDGADLVRDRNGNNVLRFSTGINIDSLSITQARGAFGEWLTILTYGNGDSVSLENAVLDSTFKLEFSDGVTLSWADFMQRSPAINGAAGSDSADTVLGSQFSDMIYGMAGNDSLQGMGGDDVLNGGVGEDTLQGGRGDDTLVGGSDRDMYLFNLGDGQDTIIDSSIGNTINFGEGLNAADMTVSQTVDDYGSRFLVLSFANGDKVSILDGVLGQIDQLSFADGTELTLNDVLANLSYVDIVGMDTSEQLYGTGHDDHVDGGKGDDLIATGAGDDDLVGGAGNDTLLGGVGKDTYHLDYGMGHDLVIDNDGSDNFIQIGSDVRNSDITMRQDGNDMVLGFKRSEGSLRLEGYYTTPQNWLFQLADGEQIPLVDFAHWQTQSQSVGAVVNAWNDFKQAARADFAANMAAANRSIGADGKYHQYSSYSGVDNYGRKLISKWERVDELVFSPQALLGYGFKAESEITSHSSTVQNISSIGMIDAAPPAPDRYFIPVQINKAFSLPQNAAVIPVYWKFAINDTIEKGGVDYASQGQGKLRGYWVYPQGLLSESNDTVRVTTDTNTHTYTVNEITGTSGDEGIYLSSDYYHKLDIAGGLVDAGAGSDRVIVQQDGYRYQNDWYDDYRPILGALLYGNNGDDYLSGGDADDVLIGGRGYDYLAGGNGADTYRLLEEDSVDVIEDLGNDADYASKWYAKQCGAYNEWQYWLRQSDYAGKWIWEPDDIYESANTREELVAKLMGDSLNNLDYDIEKFIKYVQPLPKLAIAANDYVALESLYQQGVIKQDVVCFAPEVTQDALSFTWGSRLSSDGPIRATLNISWNGTLMTQVMVPRADDPIGMGIEHFQFADGSELSMAQIMSIAPPTLDINNPPLLGTPYDDELRGDEFTNRAEILFGFDGDDWLSGWGGNDRLIGGGGDDWFECGGGDDTFEGGSGSDTYACLDTRDEDIHNAGNDVIIETPDVDGEIDSIWLNSAVDMDTLMARRNGLDLVLTSKGADGGDQSVTIRNWFDPIQSCRIEEFLLDDGNTILTADEFLARFLPIETAPVTGDPISDQAIAQDQPFQFVLPANAFADADSGDQLTLSATLANGDPLPSWLIFDAATQTFNGTPANGDVDALQVMVKATDRTGASAFQTFGLEVVNVNDAPQLDYALVDQTVQDKVAFSYTLPADTFKDVDAGDHLTLRVQLADGSALPAWLNFDTDTLTLSGTPAMTDLGALNLNVIATDLGGLTATTAFRLDVQPMPGFSLTGTAGSDVLTGNDGDDTLIGGAGNDTLAGGLGNDTYQFNLGDGIDHIQDNAGTNTLSFGAGITPGMLTLGLGSLLLKVGNNGEAIHLDNFDPNHVEDGAGIQNFRFSDGTELSYKELLLRGFSISGTAADDVLTGTSVSDTLTGDKGNDLLVGGVGDDSMEGGEGQDQLFGSAGNDELWGYTGNDTLFGGDGNDTLGGDQGDDILYGENGNDELWGYTGNDTLYGGAGNDTLGGDQNDDVLFGEAGDDELWGYTGNDSLLGGEGADTLNGEGGNDTLDGGTGSDSLLGAAGNDTYILGRGYGSDVIRDNNSTAGNTDVAQFGADIATDQLWFSHVGSNLEVSVIGTYDKFTIQNWYSGSQYHVEQFKTADGKVLLDSQVDALVSAMAAFTPPAAGQTTLSQATHDQLQPVLAANWH